MKTTIITLSLATCLLGLPCLGLAKNGDPVPGDWLLMRNGAANTSDNYGKEDSDIKDRLDGVSVLCKKIDKTTEEIQKLVDSDKTRKWNGSPWWVAKASTATGLGAKVVIDELPGNKNHCLINGLTLGQIKGIWRQFPDDQ